MDRPALALARRSLTCATALLAAGLGSTALAAGFDANTGTVSLEGSALAWSLDSLDALPAGLQLTAHDVDGNPVEPRTLSAWFSDATTPSIEGKSALWLGKRIDRLLFAFAQPERFTGRRVEISFWLQPRRVSASGTLAWILEGEREPLLGLIRFMPTGRRTDDGWMELTSGPVDFALGGRLAPLFVIRVERAPRGGYIGTDREGFVLLDALAVTDLGEAAVPGARCTLVTEQAACGELGACHLGRCCDSAPVFGPLPPEGVRGQYVDRRSFEVHHFFGNRTVDRNIGRFDAEMEQARAASSPRVFWSAITRAYEHLEDGHGSPPYPTMTERPAIGMCVHHGEADRLPASAEDAIARLPLVFWVDPSVPAASRLEIGDVLETVDGLPVDEWKALAGSRISHYGSPLAREVTVAPAIPAAAMRTGSKLGFVRCPQAIGQARRCAANELKRFEIDLYALGAEALWRGDASGWLDDRVGCDNRFQRIGGPEPRAGYMHVASEDDGDVRIIEFNGVPHPSWAGAWVDVVQGALQPTSSRFLLDERVGYGGVFDTVDLLAVPFLDPNLSVTAEIFPVIGRELDAATRDRFIECDRGMLSLFKQCGSYFSYHTGAMFPSEYGRLRDAKAALLVSLDVSGNDYLTRLHKFRPGLSRVFGPCPTYGAFGSVYGLSSYLGELSGGSAQLGDSFIYAGEGPPDFVWESGPGVAPDEVVFQTQGDLLLGRDTLVERAKAWLRE
ncbi:MAG TPA: hypothetical protein DFS52_04315 [Myxococcales bacterium]|nr:hypothetical protein [Myxococcales bacterium]